MNETRVHAGLWWSPAAPEVRLSGTLTIERGDSKLDVIGNFGRQELERTATTRTLSFELSNQERLVGMTVTGVRITLLDCTAIKQQTHLPGLETAVYRARAAVIGHLFEDHDPVLFDSVDVRTAALEEWVGYVPFPVAQPRSHEDPHFADIAIPRPQPIDVPLAAGGHVRLRFELAASGLGIATSVGKLTYRAWIGLQFPEPRTLDGAALAVHQLQNLLSLAVGRPLSISAIDVASPGVSGANGQERRLELFYAPAREPEGDVRADRREMLFTLGEIRDRLGDVVDSWLAHHEALDPVFGLYFGTLYNGHLYLEQRFLAFAQALETYDRRRRPDAKSTEPGLHQERIDEIVTAVPDAHRKWLKQKLAFSNELTLAERLEQVCRACPSVTSRIVGGEDPTIFIRAVRDTRNYYTHWDPKGKTKAATDVALYRLTVQLQAVLETLFLLELGFECERIELVLERARRFERIASISFA